MKRYLSYCWILIAGLLVASCSSTKSLRKNQMTIGNLSAEEYVKAVINQAPDWKAVTAKMQLTLARSAQEVQVSGSLKMKRDEVIQLSLAPVLGIEVARAEITPDGVLVIDRLHKKYVKVSFSELKDRMNADLDYHAFQSLFLNEIFVPGKQKLTAQDVNAFDTRIEAENAILEVNSAKRFAYQFMTTINEGLLKQTHVGLVNSPYGLKWQYGNFKPLDNKQFPTTMFVAVEGARRSMTAQFNFTRLSTNEDWEANTQLSDRYEKMEIDDLMKILFK